jgi:hypothetical protein
MYLIHVILLVQSGFGLLKIQFGNSLKSLIEMAFILKSYCYC